MGVGCAWSGSMARGVGHVLAGQWLAGRSKEGGFKRDEHPAVADPDHGVVATRQTWVCRGCRFGAVTARPGCRPYSVAASVAFSAKPVRVMAVGSVPGRR